MYRTYIQRIEIEKLSENHLVLSGSIFNHE